MRTFLKEHPSLLNLSLQEKFASQEMKEYRNALSKSDSGSNAESRDTPVFAQKNRQGSGHRKHRTFELENRNAALNFLPQACLADMEEPQGPILMKNQSAAAFTQDAELDSPERKRSITCHQKIEEFADQSTRKKGQTIWEKTVKECVEGFSEYTVMKGSQIHQKFVVKDYASQFTFKSLEASKEAVLQATNSLSDKMEEIKLFRESVSSKAQQKITEMTFF